MSSERVVEASEKQNLSCSVNNARVSEETVIVIQEEDSTDSRDVQESAIIVRDSENRSSDSGESCATGEKIIPAVKNGQKSWVIDVKNGDEEEVCDGGRICRICHLNSELPWKLPFFAAKTDLIQLGCGCKGELSNVHSYCAEAWFKLKGNRICEICGETANNIRGVGNESFMEEWKDSQVTRNATDASDRSTEGCSHGQPLCNFLMACLVIAFVLPWFLRINMF